MPDDRVARHWELDVWVATTPRHDVRIAIGYDSIESQDDVQSGGGPLRAQWSARWSADRVLAPATDVLVSLPNGDGGLHPLSAKAPSVEARLRLRLLPGLWVGGYARRVSPPSERLDPASHFPSGSGLDLCARGRLGSLGVALDLRHPTAGLPSAGLGTLRLSWEIEDGLAVELGGGVGVGPRDQRLIESQWLLGLRFSRESAAASPQRDAPSP